LLILRKDRDSLRKSAFIKSKNVLKILFGYFFVSIISSKFDKSQFFHHKDT
jgi:hypothetical protein